MGPEIDQLFWWRSAFEAGNGEDWLGNRIPCGASQTRQRPSGRCLGALADEVFAPWQQRYQLDRKIGDDEGSQRDRWDAQKSIPKNGRHS